MRKFLILAALTALSLSALGQTYISTSANGNAYHTITRSNDDGSKRIHYVKTGSASGKFIRTLGWYGNNLGFASTDLMSGYNINDFTVFNDTLYFCGNDANGKGLYGWTKISGIMWTIHIYKLYNDNDTSINNVNRIKVFRSGNDLNILLIGTYRCSGFQSCQSILHIKNNTTCTLAYSDYENFEDVALLNDYVVTVERKKSRYKPKEPHYLRILNRNNFTLHDPLFDFPHYWSGDVESIGSVRLQHTGGNNFVSAFCDDTALFINTYSANYGILAHQKVYSITTTSRPTIADMAYSDSVTRLAVLYNIDTVGKALFFKCNAFPNLMLSQSLSPFIAVTIPPTYAKLLSVIQRPSSGFVITGITSNRAFFWNTQNSSCQTQHSSTLSSRQASIDYAQDATIKRTIDIHESSFTTNCTAYYLVNALCGQ